MISKTSKKLIQKTHYWRSHQLMDELNELYVSMMLRSISLGLVGVFVPIYLYKLDYSVQSIMFYFAAVMLLRIPFNLLSGLVVAKIGPKHTIGISSFAELVYLGLLLTLESQTWPLGVLAAANSVAMALFFTAYHTDFSKIIHNVHGGKELGMMTLFQKSGAALGPLLGGLIGTFYDIRYTIGLSMILMIVSIIPLFQTAEPTRTNQKVGYKKFRFDKRDWRFMALLSAVNTSLTLLVIVWPLYLSLTVFQANVYAGVGLIATLSTVLIIATSRWIGALVDSRYSGQFMVGAGLGQIMLGVFRIFVNTPILAGWHGVAEEQLNNAVLNPVAKYYYSLADKYEGQRIAYIVMTEVLTSVPRASIYLFIGLIISLGADPVSLLKLAVVAAGFMAGSSMLLNSCKR